MTCTWPRPLPTTRPSLLVSERADSPLPPDAGGTMLALAMQPKREYAPRYNHLLEVLDGAASLRMAIDQAEMALAEPDLSKDDRAIFASVLEASRDRLIRV